MVRMCRKGSIGGTTWWMLSFVCNPKANRSVCSCQKLTARLVAAVVVAVVLSLFHFVAPYTLQS